tara:strand:- start:103090 stop:104382 length:1293 start_codon:yes stop_codon:yes gene_type:complete
VSESINVEIPTVGESISEVQIGQWLKSEGQWVASGEDLVEIETEKASVQIPAPAAGYLENISKAEEEFAAVGDVIASIRVAEKPAGEPSDSQPAPAESASNADQPAAAPAASPAAPPAPSVNAVRGAVMPAAQRMLDEHGLAASDVPATGPGGRLLKEDVQAFIRSRPTRPAAPSSAIASPSSRPTATGSLMTDATPHRSEEVKPLSMLRRTIAARLVEAQQTAALLTTFNEINMEPVMSIRSKYKDKFAEKHGVKLGFMSFFAKAAVEALRAFPAVNAEIRDDNAVYRNYQDIGIAIGGGKGLVVPILRNVERMSFADVEGSIAEFARQAGENRLQPADLIGGTFTISNGGIYGSLLSTPIVNPPQSGILGLHSIQQRPVAENGNVVIRPMMYVALTYDHRIVDGREAVGFLRTIKDVVEEPARLFLEL